MTITYIYHSCYLIESESFSILVDFYQDVQRNDGSWWIKDYLLEKKEDLYILCTHSHHDHFNPEICSWKRKKSNIKYIFSKELLESKQTKFGDAFYLDKMEIFKDEHLQIQAFGSTDIGGSFLIKVEDLYFFHAGDLNNWHWREEVEEEEAMMYETNYLIELELLSKNIKEVYLAMFPVDPRLGPKYMLGAEQFITRIKTDRFFPMHFGENYDKANAFADYAKKHNCLYFTITHKGQSFQL